MKWIFLIFLSALLSIVVYVALNLVISYIMEIKNKIKSRKAGQKEE